MRYLFLDDVRNPKDAFYMTSPILTQSKLYNLVADPIYIQKDWIVVRNYNEFVEYIEKNGVDELVISLDHDLGDSHYDFDWMETGVIDYSKHTEKSGYDVVKWLCDYCLENGKKIPEYYIHSQNTVGADNMRSYLENYKKHCEYE